MFILFYQSMPMHSSELCIYICNCTKRYKLTEMWDKDTDKWLIIELGYITKTRGLFIGQAIISQSLGELDLLIM